MMQNKGEIVHIFGWDKKFVLPFIEYIHDNFADGLHEFVVYGSVEAGDLLKQTDTVIFPSLLSNLFALSNIMNKAKKLIIHGSFNNHLLYVLSLQPWLLKKCYWVMWGGDLYAHENEQKNWRWKKNEIFRHFVIKRFGHFLTYLDGDYELVKKWYGATGKYHKCIMYQSNVFSDLSIETIPHSTINIQVGNSADPSNNHVEVFDRLASYKKQDITIYAPLSYGDKKHAEVVTKLGKKIFSDKFIPLTDFMPFNQYLEFLAKIDVAIFNHKRQQAMGNTITLLGLGKKVYMRKDVTPWAAFDEMDIKVFDVCNIDLSPLNDSDRINNQQLIKSHFSKTTLTRQLNEIFEG